MPKRIPPSYRTPPAAHVGRPQGASEVTIALRQAVQRAADAYRRGEWLEAERLCRLVINANPDHFDALRLLGAIAGQTRRSPEAVELLSRAVAANPNHPETQNNLGNALKDLNRLEEAVLRYDLAISLKRDYADAYSN